MMRTDDMKEKKTREAGFTLLEVIVAISILTVGLLAVASMQTAAIHGNDTAYRITETVTWAQDRLEYLLALPYDDAALSIGTGKADPMTSPPHYTITYDVIDGPVSNTKRITVTATRQSGGVTKSRRLSSIKTEM
jgi:prepilin-type N-terminal cleavage/methylation domain-containing protein